MREDPSGVSTSRARRQELAQAGEDPLTGLRGGRVLLTGRPRSPSLEWLYAARFVASRQPQHIKDAFLLETLTSPGFFRDACPACWETLRLRRPLVTLVLSLHTPVLRELVHAGGCRCQRRPTRPKADFHPAALLGSKPFCPSDKSKPKSKPQLIPF